MKYIILVLCIATASCSKSTGDKLKDRIENRWKDQKVQQLKIDSFKFEVSNLKGYYTTYLASKQDYLKSQMDLFNKTKVLGSNDLTVKLLQGITETSNEIEFVKKQIEEVQPSPKVYNIDYNISYENDGSIYQGHKEVFLYAHDLSEVNINIDSLYKLSGNSVGFDSATKIGILKMDDSLDNVIQSLKRELDLKIASGIPKGIELNYRLRIAKLQALKAENKLKGPSLFME